MLIHHKERLSNESVKKIVSDCQGMERSFKDFKHENLHLKTVVFNPTFQSTRRTEDDTCHQFLKTTNLRGYLQNSNTQGLTFVGGKLIEISVK